MARGILRQGGRQALLDRFERRRGRPVGMTDPARQGRIFAGGDDGRWRRWHHDERQRRRFHRGFVGWVGPVFWPYFYSDAFSYAFWPRDEDYYAGPFWGSAYDDAFESVFWPDAVGSGDYATGSTGRTPRLAARSRAGTRGIAGQSKDYAEICGERDASLVEWPFARIEEAIEPTADQQTALDALREAADKATEALKAACPERLPATPLGRLDAMAVRMRAARQALDLMRPALNVLYDSLSDEQKARFNAIQPADAGKAAAAGPGKQADTDSPARICGDATGPGLSTRLAQRLEQTVHPLEAQRLALDELKDASARAVDILHGACPTEMPQTPPARLDAMRARIVAMLEAVDMVRPALAKFYGALSDEQKARFNTISRQEQG